MQGHELLEDRTPDMVGKSFAFLADSEIDHMLASASSAFFNPRLNDELGAILDVRGVRKLVEIPAFDFQSVDMQVGDENIPRLHRRRSISRIRTSRRSVGEFVTATRRQFELSITIRQGGQVA